MNALITGINGFIGTHLTEYLVGSGFSVSGTSRSTSSQENTKVYDCDLTNLKVISKVIKDSKPDYIFHLAAQSNIPYSFTHPQETVDANVNLTINLLETLKLSKSKSVFVSVGSSSEYGHSDNKTLAEYSFPQPSSPYAITKLAQSHFVELYRRSFNIKAVHVRPFAIIGPRKKGDAVSDFARGIIAIERGERKTLQVGDLSHTRDFLDVRDAVRALQLIAEKPTFSAFNICSGQGVKLEDLLHKLIKLAKIDIQVKIDPTKRRPADDPKIIGNPERLFSLGFKPNYSIDQTLTDILNYWRGQD